MSANDENNGVSHEPNSQRRGGSHRKDQNRRQHNNAKRKRDEESSRIDEAVKNAPRGPSRDLKRGKHEEGMSNNRILDHRDDGWDDRQARGGGHRGGKGRGGAGGGKKNRGGGRSGSRQRQRRGRDRDRNRGGDVDDDGEDDVDDRNFRRRGGRGGRAPTGRGGPGSGRERSRSRNRNRNHSAEKPREKDDPRSTSRSNYGGGNNYERSPRDRDTTSLTDQPRPPSPPRASMRLRPVYKRVQQVGEGTYGKVYKAVNEDTGHTAALKKLRLEQERDGMPITAVREIKLLQSLRHHSIVSLREMMIEKSEVFMAFEYVDHDLAGLLLNKQLVITSGQKKNLFKQMMEGLAYLHHKHILHRDIKGSNILVDKYGHVKLADFGLARKADLNNPQNHYTNRVITLWYRPPELLLGATVYNGGIDVWGMGCLLVELFTREAIFQGKDDVGQLTKVYEVMGTPTQEIWGSMTKLPWYQLLLPKDEPLPRKFEDKYQGVLPSDALGLASQMLIYDPEKRMTAEQSLNHEYFSNAPAPEGLDLTEIGEWHDFEAKNRRRKERERQKERERRDQTQLVDQEGEAAEKDERDLDRSQAKLVLDKSNGEPEGASNESKYKDAEQGGQVPEDRKD